MKHSRILLSALACFAMASAAFAAPPSTASPGVWANSTQSTQSTSNHGLKMAIAATKAVETDVSLTANAGAIDLKHSAATGIGLVVQVAASAGPQVMPSHFEKAHYLFKSSPRPALIALRTGGGSGDSRS